MTNPETGSILIAEPFLKDPNFIRTVIFLCDHRDEGTFGFVLNKALGKTLDEFVPELDGHKIPVFYGGPVQLDTLHFLHTIPDLIPGGMEVINGVYWGGDFELLVEMIKKEEVNLAKIRFFLGYSGWDEGQLVGELKEKTWITSRGTRKLIFHPKAESIWEDALKTLGGDYKMMVNFPIDPSLN